MSHTPGPWRVFGARAESGTSQEIHTESKFIARVFMNENPLEREANARLIACAPELLEALKRIKQTGVFVGAIAQEMMDAAIAKATGEQA